MEMNRKIVVGLALLRLLGCSLATATCVPLFAQEATKSDPKPRLSLGVLIDTSAHQKKVIEFERQAINAIAGRFESAATESFVFTYADKVELLQDWSPLETGLKTISTRIELDIEGGKGGRTLLNDALSAGLLKLEAKGGSDAKALIVIGEGNDWGSAARYSQIKKLAKSRHVQCFALLIADHDLMGGRVRHFGFDVDDLAWSTKGNGYDVGSSRKHLDKAVKDVLKRITRQLQAQATTR
jgi:hypothetical protein